MRIFINILTSYLIMDNHINELGYKNHDPFFHNLNNNFQSLLVITTDTMKDITRLEDMYICLNSFYIFYSPYMKENKESIQKSLKNMRDFIYSREFQDFINKRKGKESVLREAIEILNSLNDTIPNMMSNIHDNSLFPRLSKIDNETPGMAKNGNG